MYFLKYQNIALKYQLYWNHSRICTVKVTINISYSYSYRAMSIHVSVTFLLKQSNHGRSSFVHAYSVCLTLLSFLSSPFSTDNVCLTLTDNSPFFLLSSVFLSAHPWASPVGGCSILEKAITPYLPIKAIRPAPIQSFRAPPLKTMKDLRQNKVELKSIL